MQVRIATQNDIHWLYEMNEQFNGAGCTTAEQLADSILHNRQETVFIAAAANTALGFCCVQFFKSMCYSVNYAEITELFVKEEYRGQGVGTALMTCAEDYFKTQNVKGYQLFTGKDNTSAQSFYEKMGYKKSAELMYRKRL